MCETIVIEEELITPDELRDRRLGLGLTQEEFAEAAGYEGRHRRMTIQRLESGREKIYPKASERLRRALERLEAERVETLTGGQGR